MKPLYVELGACLLLIICMSIAASVNITGEKLGRAADHQENEAPLDVASNASDADDAAGALSGVVRQ